MRILADKPRRLLWLVVALSVTAAFIAAFFFVRLHYGFTLQPGAAMDRFCVGHLYWDNDYEIRPDRDRGARLQTLIARAKELGFVVDSFSAHDDFRKRDLSKIDDFQRLDIMEAHLRIAVFRDEVNRDQRPYLIVADTLAESLLVSRFAARPENTREACFCVRLADAYWRIGNQGEVSLKLLADLRKSPGWARLPRAIRARVALIETEAERRVSYSPEKLPGFGNKLNDVIRETDDILESNSNERSRFARFTNISARLALVEVLVKGILNADLPRETSLEEVRELVNTVLHDEAVGRRDGLLDLGLKALFWAAEMSTYQAGSGGLRTANQYLAHSFPWATVARYPDMLEAIGLRDKSIAEGDADMLWRLAKGLAANVVDREVGRWAESTTTQVVLWSSGD